MKTQINLVCEVILTIKNVYYAMTLSYLIVNYVLVQYVLNVPMENI